MFPQTLYPQTHSCFKDTRNSGTLMPYEIKIGLYIKSIFSWKKQLAEMIS